MHYNMAIQRALVFTYLSNSVFAASYLARQDQSYEWISGLVVCDAVMCVCECVCVYTRVHVCTQAWICMCIYIPSVTILCSL